MRAAYSITIFLSAFLLFLTQPLFGKMILPYLGGTPAVWNTAMFFFQACLLCGYAYAHFTLKWLGWQRQCILHLLLMLAAISFLPLGVPDGWRPPAATDPTFALLTILFLQVGLPFFVLSASAPLLQRWFSLTNDPQRQDPYFLYAASNSGSMLALFAFPLLLEPQLRLSAQSVFWQYLYYALIIGFGLSLVFLVRRIHLAFPLDDEPSTRSRPVSWKQRRRWTLLAFVPSALLLAVTQYITSDIAIASLFWVLPLALYLFTFVLVFSNAFHWISPPTVQIYSVGFLILVLLTLFTEMKAAHPVLLFLHLGYFFSTALVCHHQLAESKPPVVHLTEFFLWMSLGGVLGGMMVALVAPIVFDSLLEYPILIILAALVTPAFTWHRRVLRMRVVRLAILIPLFVIFVYGFKLEFNSLPLKIAHLCTVVGGVAALLLTIGRPKTQACVLAVFVAVGHFTIQDQVLLRARSFFGPMEVRYDSENNWYTFVHGTTVHGIQSADSDKKIEPKGYYHRQGNFGEIMRQLNAGDEQSKKTIALIGLGIGTLACYGKADDTYDYFEIDPAVYRIAKDERFFTYLRDCPPLINVFLGDARLTISDAVDGRYDAIVIDAFSSDAIPTHLMTLEALRLYRKKLKATGFLIYHISNQHLDLAPVVHDLAAAEKLRMFYRSGLPPGAEADFAALEAQGVFPASVAVVGEMQNLPGAVSSGISWKQYSRDAISTPWTDDFANILATYKLLRK